MTLQTALQALSLAVLCVGCSGPGLIEVKHVPARPSASGFVLDSDTHAPLAGAKLVMLPSQASKSLSEVVEGVHLWAVVTDKDGDFDIPTKHKWIVIFLLGDVFPPSGTLVVTRAGYEPQMINQAYGTWDHMEILMKKVPD